MISAGTIVLSRSRLVPIYCVKSGVEKVLAPVRGASFHHISQLDFQKSGYVWRPNPLDWDRPCAPRLLPLPKLYFRKCSVCGAWTER